MNQSAGLAGQEAIPLDRYRVVTPIEEGASLFSAYAYDLQRERGVFIKTIDPSKENAHQRLLREADVLESLDHPQIPKLVDVECSDEFKYIVTDAMPGSPAIAEKLKRKRPKPLAVAKLCASALDVLGYVHDSGYVHRDIKTGNFVLQLKGAASLVDFELAKHNRGFFGDEPDFGTAMVSQRLADTEITAPGSIAGTAGYMAPEQMMSATAIPQSDIYGVGSMLHELLSGRLPFTFAGETKVKTGELAARKIEPREDYFWQTRRPIPPALRFIAEKALQPNVNDRYVAAGEMAEDLRRFLASPSLAAVELDTRANAYEEFVKADDTPTEKYIVLPRLVAA